MEEAIGLIGDEVAVRASPSALVSLSERPWLFALDTTRQPSVAQAGFPDFTRAVLILEDQILDRDETEREEFDRGMAAQGFALLYDESGVTLYSRQEADIGVGSDE